MARTFVGILPLKHWSTDRPGPLGMKKILFVCTGNVCRSPMAEGFFRELTSERGDYQSLSAGLAAIDGQPPSTHSVSAMQEVGIDIAGQRSIQITPELVDAVDYIFGLANGHVENMMRYFPQAREKIFLLREFVGELPPAKREISDPIGCDLEIYKICRNQIKQGIESIIPFLEQQLMTNKNNSHDYAGEIVNGMSKENRDTLLKLRRHMIEAMDEIAKERTKLQYTKGETYYLIKSYTVKKSKDGNKLPEPFSVGNYRPRQHYSVVI